MTLDKHLTCVGHWFFICKTKAINKTTGSWLNDYLSSSTEKFLNISISPQIFHLESTAVEVTACDYILRQGQGLHRKGRFIPRSSSVWLRHWFHSQRWGRNPLTPTVLSAAPRGRRTQLGEPQGVWLHTLPGARPALTTARLCPAVRDTGQCHLFL